MTEGDIIKLGKIKLRIREIHPFGSLEDSLESPIEETKTEEFIQKQQVEKLYPFYESLFLTFLLIGLMDKNSLAKSVLKLNIT